MIVHQIVMKVGAICPPLEVGSTVTITKVKRGSSKSMTPTRLEEREL